jgi:hypothetical protein
MNDLIWPYYELVTQNFNTLLARTYGVYTLSVGLAKVTIILMENVAPIPNDKVIRRFDLKGSLLGRETKNLNLHINNKFKVFKDKDFLDMIKCDEHLIDFEHKSILSILETLTYDIDLLRSCNIMDYSFFITITENYEEFNIDDCIVGNRTYFAKDEKHIYFIGIIDYLTKFDRFKMLENTYKSIMNYSIRHTISAVNPVMYADRYYNFIKEKIFKIKRGEKK